MVSAVFMGVAGCGKSSAALAVARRLGWAMVEGDDYHAEVNQAKMREGKALTDQDRADWLTTLGRLLADYNRHGRPVLITCSALKRSYRDLLRQSSPGLCFVYLEIDKPTALQRVAARAGSHWFPPSLVDSQFSTLEPPHDEPGVLCVDALCSRDELAREISHWLRPQVPHAPS